MSGPARARPRVDWPTLHSAIARRAWQMAFSVAGPMRKDDLEYRRAYDAIEAAKAVEVAELVEAWKAGQGVVSPGLVED